MILTAPDPTVFVPCVDPEVVFWKKCFLLSGSDFYILIHYRNHHQINIVSGKKQGSSQLVAFMHVGDHICICIYMHIINVYFALRIMISKGSCLANTCGEFEKM